MKRGKNEVNGQGGRGVPQPHMGQKIASNASVSLDATQTLPF